MCYFQICDKVCEFAQNSLWEPNTPGEDLSSITWNYPTLFNAQLYRQSYFPTIIPYDNAEYNKGL